MCGAPIPPPLTQGLLRRLKMLGSVYEQVKSEALENDEENNESRINCRLYQRIRRFGENDET